MWVQKGLKCCRSSRAEGGGWETSKFFSHQNHSLWGISFHWMCHMQRGCLKIHFTLTSLSMLPMPPMPWGLQCPKLSPPSHWLFLDMSVWLPYQLNISKNQIHHFSFPATNIYQARISLRFLSLAYNSQIHSWLFSLASLPFPIN